MLRGHYWTLRRHLASSLRPAHVASRAWFVDVPDERFGSVRLSGRLAIPESARDLVVIVHGLGGSSQSAYVQAAASCASALGLASLRLNLRGADLRGEDLYHAGLGSDLGAALAARELAMFQRVHLLGYSLGGHVCLSYAAGAVDPRVQAVAAVCSPLQLSLASRIFDEEMAFVYRAHVLRGLIRMYRAFYARRAPRGLPDPEEIARIGGVRAWDAKVIARRYGFVSREHYYARASAAPLLRRIRVRTLLLHSRTDPMVPIGSVRPFTSALCSSDGPVHVAEAEDGGHVGFPERFSLGEPGGLGLHTQVLTWLSGPDSARRPTTAREA